MQSKPGSKRCQDRNGNEMNSAGQDLAAVISVKLTSDRFNLISCFNGRKRWNGLPASLSVRRTWDPPPLSVGSLALCRRIVWICCFLGSLMALIHPPLIFTGWDTCSHSSLNQILNPPRPNNNFEWNLHEEGYCLPRGGGGGGGVAVTAL